MLDGADGLGEDHGRSLRSYGTILLLRCWVNRLSQSKVLKGLDSSRRGFGGCLGALCGTARAEPTIPGSCECDTLPRTKGGTIYDHLVARRGPRLSRSHQGQVREMLAVLGAYTGTRLYLMSMHVISA